MPRDAFAALDARISRSIERKVGEPCTWVPMASVAVYADAYTSENVPREDPARARVAGIVAAVTWKPGTDKDGNSPVATGSILVEIDRRFFAGLPLPVRGDHFDLPEQEPGERLVSVARVADDGSERIDFWCTLVVTK